MALPNALTPTTARFTEPAGRTGFCPAAGAARCAAAHPAHWAAYPENQPAPPKRPTALPETEVIGYPEVIGQIYSVETIGGTQFSGTLQASTNLTLTFETKELGLITVQRADVRQLMSQTPEQARRGFDYVGNGTRMFLAPRPATCGRAKATCRRLTCFCWASTTA
ncbi:MAG: hypothetical protein WKG07_21655 [Hymenobacter sp.]